MLMVLHNSFPKNAMLFYELCRLISVNSLIHSRWIGTGGAGYVIGRDRLWFLLWAHLEKNKRTQALLFSEYRPNSAYGRLIQYEKPVESFILPK